jgi:hypothetical protein
MAEFQWWVFIVGLAVGGTVVGMLVTRLQRTDADLEADEREAEAMFIAGHLSDSGTRVDAATVAVILEAHREYLGLPAPVAIVPADAPPTPPSWPAPPAPPDQPATDTPITSPTT